MKPHSHRFLFLPALGVLAVSAMLAITPGRLLAQEKKTNPASKIYVASMEGQSQINQDNKIADLTQKSAYNAEGSVIETKPKARNALVYSNGTGIFFDSDTRVEVTKFLQEPFTPNRNDMEVEPSISQTEGVVTRGTIGLCTSKLVAGSTMNYRTSLGSVSIRGGKIVIQAEPESTKISMLEGESTVRGGTLDLGGQVLHAGEQAVIKPGPPGAPNVIKIDKIPDADRSSLDDKVLMACAAKKTVYFETNGHGPNADPEIVPVPVVPANLPVPITISPAKLPD
jgi:hypothetical protein